MAEVASAYVTLIPSVTGWQQKIASAIGGGSEAAGRDAGQKLGRGILQGSSNSFVLLSAKFAALGAALKVFDFAKGAVVDFNSQLQEANIAFTTMLGSATQAQQTLKDLQQFAKTTPFDFPQLVTASQRLIAFGFSAKQIIPTLTAIGDAAAGLGGGAGLVEQITTAIGQINAKGRLQSDELLQLTEAGIPALRILAAEFGMTTGQVQQLVTANKIAASVAIPALLQGLEKGTKDTAAFGGMMDAQSKTFVGALSNIKDALQQSLGQVGKPLFDAMSQAALKLSDYLSGPAFAGWGQKLSTSLATGLKDVIDFAGKARQFLSQVFTSDTFQRALANIRTAFSDLVSFVTQSLFPAIVSLWQGFGQDALTAFGAIAQAAAVLAGFFKDTVGPAVKEVADFLGKNKDLVEGLGTAILAAVGAWKAYNLVIDAVKGAQLLLNAVMDANPVFLIVSLIGALAGAFIYAYTTSETFRDKVAAVFHFVEQVIGKSISGILHVLRLLVDGFFNVMGGVATALVKLAEALHLPFADGAKKGLDELNKFKDDTDQFFQGLENDTYNWGVQVGQALDVGTANSIEAHLGLVQNAARKAYDAISVQNNFNKALGLGGDGTTSGAPGNFVEITDALRKTNDAAFKFDPSEFKKATAAGTGLGASYVEAVKNAITAGVPAMEKATNALLAAVKKQAAKQGVGSGIITTIAIDNVRLVSLAKQRQGIADELDKATKRLQDAVTARDNFRQSTLDTALGTGSLTNFIGSNGVGSSFARIRGGLARAVANMKRLIADVAKLRAEGLDPALLQQIVAAGPDQGLEAAQALLQKGAGGISDVNKLQAQLQSLASGFANKNTAAFFNVGVQTAQGIVDGLKAKESLIEAEMNRIAQIMQTAIRKALGIQSPSRVFRALFAHVPEGAALGIRDGSDAVTRAVSDMTRVPSTVGVGATSGPAAMGGFTQTNNIVVQAAPGEAAAESLPRALRQRAWANGWARA